MARRSKEEAQATRARLLDTAERLFRDKGVARTSLAEIAAAAGVTRGAIYWHFENKADLFQAMCDRVVLPLETLLCGVAVDDLADPLCKLREAGVEVLRRVQDDARCRRVFEILTFKCEFAEELEPTMRRRLECRRKGIDAIARNLANAIALGQLPSTLDARRAALAFFAYIDGLIHNWSLDPNAHSLANEAATLIDLFLDGLRAAPRPGAARLDRAARRRTAR